MSTEFIAGNYIDPKICDNLIEWFEDNVRYQYEGVLGSGLNKEWKDSTDIQISPNCSAPCIREYLDALSGVFGGYLQKYPWATDDHGPYSILEAFNLQRYYPGQGFHKWHCERNCADGTNPFRHLVFMTYLNDVTDGGETEWLHQQIKIKPEKGLTVIWPADWTFVHRGIPSPTQTKYIATGWYGYKTERCDYDYQNQHSVI